MIACWCFMKTYFLWFERDPVAYNKRNVIDRRAFSCLLFSFMQMYRKRNFLQSLGHMFIIFRTQGHQILVCLWSNESVIEISFATLCHRGRIFNSSINVSFTVLYSPPQMFSQDHSFFSFASLSLTTDDKLESNLFCIALCHFHTKTTSVHPLLMELASEVTFLFFFLLYYIQINWVSAVA